MSLAERALEDQPLAGLVLRGEGLDLIQDLVRGAAAHVVPEVPGVGGQLQVGVRVDQPGDHRPPGQVDELGPRPGRGTYFLVAAHQADLPVPDGDRRRHRARRVHGDYPPAVQDQVGSRAVARERRGHPAASAEAEADEEAGGALTPPRQ
jgi:hypothetical protein